MQFGEKIRLLRKRAGISQKDLQSNSGLQDGLWYTMKTVRLSTEQD
jgi:transcriptional regulator with XRE-family HTH domain